MDKGISLIHRMDASVRLGDQRQSRKALRNGSWRCHHETGVILDALAKDRLDREIPFNVGGSIRKININSLYHLLGPGICI